MKLTPVKEVVEEIVNNCGNCIYGMNIDASGKEMKRIYSELENSPLLKNQIIQTLTQRDQEWAEMHNYECKDAYISGASAERKELLDAIEGMKKPYNKNLEMGNEWNIRQNCYNQALEEIKALISNKE